MPGKPPYLAPPKTPASYRTVPLLQVVVDALAAHLAAVPVPAVPAEITDAAGRPLRRTRFSPVWRPATATAGLGDG